MAVTISIDTIIGIPIGAESGDDAIQRAVSELTLDVVSRVVEDDMSVGSTKAKRVDRNTTRSIAWPAYALRRNLMLIALVQAYQPSHVI